MNHLLRSLAPISEAGWQLLDGEARARLTPALGARRLIDVAGPHGWEHSATNLGRTRALTAASAEGITAAQRLVLPLIELRADFSLPLSALQDVDRGDTAIDLGPLDEAAHRLAEAEGRAVFDGISDALVGIIQAAPHADKPETGDSAAQIATAVTQLLQRGVGGPYGLALGTAGYHDVLANTERGYPLRQHLEQILGGAIVWVPGLNSAVVMSVRGGDFILDCGQDHSLGYASHDADEVRLYLQESFSFRVATPEAAVVLSQ